MTSTALQAFLPIASLGDPWIRVPGSDPRALAIVDGWHPAAGGMPHYSRQTPGSPTFTGNGSDLVLVTRDGLSVWSVVYQRVNGYENDDGSDAEMRWRCNVFRRLGGGRASDLIKAAVEATRTGWLAVYGELPTVPLTTEVDPAKTRKKRDPGRCFRKAGWKEIGTTPKGLVRLEAPPMRDGTTEAGAAA
jgi:hypothetical protein